MLGFIARFAGCLALAAGTAIAVGDIARSISADALRLSSLSQVWDVVSGSRLEDGTGAAPDLMERLGTMGTTLLTLPAAPSLALLAIVLLLVGRRRVPVRYVH